MGENILSEELRRAAIPSQPATEEVIVSNQPQQPPTGEQAVNVATLNGAAQDKAQYRAAQQEALAQQSLQQNMAALANLFTDYSRPSDDIYNETYDNLVMNGIYGDNAHKIASRKASEYSANRLARLQMGMQMDGVTNDGYLTNNGMYYLTQMQGEDPAVASLYAQGYANMPKVAYDRQWDLTKGDYNAARQFDYSQKAADAQMNRQMTLAQFTNNLNTQQKLALMQAEPEVRMQIAKRFGLSDVDAAAFALGFNGGNRGNGRSGGRSNNGGVDYKTLESHAKFLRSNYVDETTGKWTNPQMEQEYNRTVERMNDIVNERQAFDSSDPQSVAAFATAIASRNNIPVSQALQAIKERYPDANIEAAFNALQKESENDSFDPNAVMESVPPTEDTETDETDKESKNENSNNEKEETNREPAPYNASLEDSAVAKLNETNEVTLTPDEQARERQRDVLSDWLNRTFMYNPNR